MTKNYNETHWFSQTSSTQTMRTWARRIHNHEEIPDNFYAAFPEVEEAFPYTIYIPADKRSRYHQRDAKIIILLKESFILLEDLAGSIQTHTSKFTNVISLEHGIILLNSWLKIETLSGRFEVRFNTTNDHLLAPIINTIRQKMIQPAWQTTAPGTINQEKPNLSQLDFLESINFKFRNYGKRSIQDDDAVLAVVYQAERPLQDIRLFRKTLFKRYKTDFLIILTREELIFIKEDKQIRTNFDPNHGGVFTYIPQHQIQDITFTPQPENNITLMQVTLPNDHQLVSELSADTPQLQQLQEQLQG